MQQWRRLYPATSQQLTIVHPPVTRRHHLCFLSLLT